MLQSSGRGRTTVVVVAAVCAVLVIVVAARYVWLREQRRSTEHHVATLTVQLTDALALFREVQSTRSGADEHNATTRAHRDQVRAAAAALHQQLSLTRADTTAAEIGAFTSGAQANNLRACLTGVSQALNQLAVGDRRAVASLRSVDAPCRAVGIQ